MTPAQVGSFKSSVPTSPSPRRLETFNDVPRRKRNIQFFFERGRLRRIGVYLGEGTDRKKAVATCQQLYELLQRDYGPVTIPEDKSAKGAKPVPAGVQAVAATMNADLFGATHIVPIKQPKDMRVFGTIRSANIGGQKWFYVAVNFDQRT